jgi:hypothetical protein
MIQAKFSQIKKINPGIRDSWDGKIFLSFDIDWAHDEVILDCYNLVSNYSIDSTWFVTHETDALNTLRLDKRIELGAHPNFNDLLSGSAMAGETSNLVVRKSRELVPEATTIRSHSLTQSERILDQFLDNGYIRFCNLFIPYLNEMQVFPYSLWSGGIIIPHRFQDNASLRIGESLPERQTLNMGLHVFDFHPIHVFLNTESLERYERTRPLHHNPEELIKHRYEGYGVRSRLIEILKLAENS